MGRFWFPNLIVFISSACIMIIELVAGRLMAPHMGVSLYTWTSIIGVVLAGISLGNYLGGQLADRFPSREMLSLIFLAAGLASLSVLATDRFLGRAMAPSSLPLILRILIYTTLVFFLPSCILGMVSPLVVKLSLQDLARTGNVVGKIYAFSALGSIFGTFATGFFLISWYGTRTIVWAISAFLILMGLAFASSKALRRGLFILPLLFLAGLVFLLLRGRLTPSCTAETNYYCIKVHDDVLEDKSTVRVLTLDRLVHSYTSLEDPTKLVYDYEKIYAEITTYAAQANPAPRVLFIGGGGYTFPKYMELMYPDSALEVVEIDPGVTQIAHQDFGLSSQTSIVTYNEDARIFFNRLPPNPRYDLIIGDAFNDFSVPYHLTTLEFNHKVQSLLTKDGIYMVNVVDGHRGLFLRAYLTTLRQTFPYVYLIPTMESWRAAVRSTFVIVCTKKPLDLQEIGTKEVLSTLLSPEELEEFLGEWPTVILRDDHVPTDNLLAPVYTDSAS